MTGPPLCVFDCTVFAQALINPKGPAGACLAAAQANRLIVMMSDYIVQEIRELQDKLPARLLVTSQRIENLLSDTAKYAELAETPPDVFAYSRDPEDAHYLNLAIEHDADYLVSRDRDLLDLDDNADFRARFPRLKVVTPPELLQAIAQHFD